MLKLTLLWAVWLSAHPLAAAGTCRTASDYTDPVYGAAIRQSADAESHRHNLYYYRDPWNADRSYMAGVRTDPQQQNWKVVLYDGSGCFLKELFPISSFDWRIAWDRNDPDVLYTLNGGRIYSYNVTSGTAKMLKTVAPLGIKPAGLSLNQDGDRLMVVTSDNTFRSFRLPGMDEERSFQASYPTGCAPGWDKERYIGHRNYIATACSSGAAANQAMLMYDDDGRLHHRFDELGGGGHDDFSPDGKWAYFTLWTRTAPLEIHVVNIDGSDDRVLVRVPAAELRYVQNLHLSWPRKVNDWFIASFFPNASRLPTTYAPYLDEIVRIELDGSTRILARTETAYSAVTRQAGGAQDMFWAQPLARPSADGSRINFNSNRAGTIGQYVLWLDGGAARGR
jgi:hypothetical protein